MEHIYTVKYYYCNVRMFREDGRLLVRPVFSCGDNYSIEPDILQVLSLENLDPYSK
jgi:hypothetical protein